MTTDRKERQSFREERGWYRVGVRVCMCGGWRKMECGSAQAKGAEADSCGWRVHIVNSGNRTTDLD